MKKYLVGFVKYSRFVYAVYFYCGSALLRVLRWFVRLDDRLLLFVSYGGKKFDDSPKAVYRALIEDPRFAGFRIVWAFNRPEAFDIPIGEKIRTDTLKYFTTALKARCWITNSSVERGLSFIGKHTFQVNTWHGSPIKKMGGDIARQNNSFKSKSTVVPDVFLAQSRFDADIFSRVFAIPKNRFRIIGLPRNDELANTPADRIASFRCELGIPEGKQAILYAPTFREYDQTKAKECTLALPVDFGKWKRELGDRYVLLLRAHYEVAHAMGAIDGEFVRDVSGFPDLNKLMLASDLLVSDYSSIFFDYSILNKPMLCFAYDYDKYAEQRGVYFDIREELSAGRILTTENDVIAELKNFDRAGYIRKTAAFREKYVTEYGRSSQRTVAIITENLGLR